MFSESNRVRPFTPPFAGLKEDVRASVEEKVRKPLESGERKEPVRRSLGEYLGSNHSQINP